jgi:hypothetical protein
MGSNPIASGMAGDVVQLVERMFCTHEVIGSNPIVSKPPPMYCPNTL